jgi:hypothetical protein
MCNVIYFLFLFFKKLKIYFLIKKRKKIWGVAQTTSKNETTSKTHWGWFRPPPWPLVGGSATPVEPLATPLEQGGGKNHHQWVLRVVLTTPNFFFFEKKVYFLIFFK